MLGAERPRKHKHPYILLLRPMTRGIPETVCLKDPYLYVSNIYHVLYTIYSMPYKQINKYIYIFI